LTPRLRPRRREGTGPKAIICKAAGPAPIAGEPSVCRTWGTFSGSTAVRPRAAPRAHNWGKRNCRPVRRLRGHPLDRDHRHGPRRCRYHVHDLDPSHSPPLFYPRRHVLPSEQGGASHRSSRPQQVCPACRAVRPLAKKGTVGNLSNNELPHSGQVTAHPPCTRISKVVSQPRQRYTYMGIAHSSDNRSIRSTALPNR
jgi:hypothetical protein